MDGAPERILGRALARHGTGDLPGALEDYRRLLVLLPQDATAAINGVVAWHGLGRPDHAAPLCLIARRLVPGLAAGHLVSAENWRLLGNRAEALAAFRRVFALQPDLADGLNNFANFLTAEDEPTAIRLFWRAVRLAPINPEPHANLAAALLADDRPEPAWACARQAILLAPGRADSYNNFGNCLFELRDYDAALTALRRARMLFPAFADACVNEGGLRLDLGQAALGSAISRLAVLLAPERAASYNNLANGELLACRLPAAETSFLRALRLDPTDAQTHFNYAAVLLKQGRLVEGWAEYEWRRRTPAALLRRRRFDPPDWPGGDPAGVTLLLSVEQGFGDGLQFCRFAPWLATQGARVVLRTNRPLVRLMRSLEGVSQVVDFDQVLPEFDFHLPLMSVPARYALSLDDIPAMVPYLTADKAQIDSWRQRLRDYQGVKVGLAWSGAPRPGQRSAHLLDRRRSLTLGDFAELVALDGLTPISLQKDAPASSHVIGGKLVDWTDELRDFADTAALIAALDLVITVDTAIAHLAGALGKPVWILSRFDGCWRWLEGRGDSPWYPTARLFRQRSPGDWSLPLADMRESLRRRIVKQG